jgi:hypothetical protein
VKVLAREPVREPAPQHVSAVVDDGSHAERTHLPSVIGMYADGKNVPVGVKSAVSVGPKSVYHQRPVDTHTERRSERVRALQHAGGRDEQHGPVSSDMTALRHSRAQGQLLRLDFSTEVAG